MEKVTIDDVENEPHEMGVNTVRRYVGDVLGTDHLAFVLYELEPGDQFSGGLHTHHDQEEVFYILEGTATFEYTMDRKEVEVAAGEAILFPSGELQVGHNRGDERVVAIALGAPVASSAAEEIEWIHECEVCGEETSHGIRSIAREEEEGELVSYCMECGNEFAA